MDQQKLFSLMVELHRGGARQGPGSAEQTLRALELASVDRTAELRVADIGCGTGASTITLAGALPRARITAVDLFGDFLQILSDHARDEGCSDRIETVVASMDALSFDPGSLDLMWSEGAIYNIGFANGIESWRPFLRPGGILAVSEITWLHPNPPDEIRDFWHAEYPQIATASEKIAILERTGYVLLGYLVLPPSNWIDNYYEPAEQRIDAFLKRHADSPEAMQVVEEHRTEAELYLRHQDSYSYGFYIARKR